MEGVGSWQDKLKGRIPDESGSGSRHLRDTDGAEAAGRGR